MESGFSPGGFCYEKHTETMQVQVCLFLIKKSQTRMTASALKQDPAHIKGSKERYLLGHSSGAVWESRWPSWAVRPNEPSGFRGRKDLLNRASALVTTCP